jgi:hypothetical protein
MRNIILLIAISFVACAAGAPVDVNVISVEKIWDAAPHNAFTDLIRWQGDFYCVFREGKTHGSMDGKIRVLKSADAESWKSVALLSLEDADLRDPHICVTPDNTLMIVGGLARFNEQKRRGPAATFVSFSKNASGWTPAKQITEQGFWLWDVAWHNGVAYGFTQPTRSARNLQYIQLVKSTDGINFKPVGEKLMATGSASISEVAIEFDANDTAYALVRRRCRTTENCGGALLGIAQPPYTNWQYHDLGEHTDTMGGPALIQIGDHWLAAGRKIKEIPGKGEGSGSNCTALYYLDMKTKTAEELLQLRSAGDTSYPAFIWHNKTLYMSYYSTHQNKTSIYLVKLKIKEKLKPL